MSIDVVRHCRQDATMQFWIHVQHSKYTQTYTDTHIIYIYIDQVQKPWLYVSPMFNLDILLIGGRGGCCICYTYYYFFLCIYEVYFSDSCIHQRLNIIPTNAPPPLKPTGILWVTVRYQNCIGIYTINLQVFLLGGRYSIFVNQYSLWVAFTIPICTIQHNIIYLLITITNFKLYSFYILYLNRFIIYIMAFMFNIVSMFR